MEKVTKIFCLTVCVILSMIIPLPIAYAIECPIPTTPLNPSPPDGATNVSVNPTLSWSTCSNTDSYNVYFGTSSNPPYLSNTTNVNYSLTDLASNSIYFWRVVAMNNCGNFTMGPVWSFWTVCMPPAIPSNPMPQNGAWVIPTPTPSKSGVIYNVSLGWTSSDANSYDVYFGTSSNPPFLGNTLTGSYYVSGLTLNTTYFWRVVALNDCGYSTSGPVWSFTTSPANPFSNWTNIEPPNVSSDWSLNSVYFTSSNEGWAVGVDNQNNRGVLLHYLNGTWTSVNPPDFSPSWELSAVYFTSANEGWAVGTEIIAPIGRGVLLHYLNGSWTNMTPPNLGSNWGLNSVHLTSSNEGWAVGTDHGNQKGVLLYYFNGNWEAINPPDYPYPWGLNSVHFTSPNEGWAVGVGSSEGQISKNLFLHYMNDSWISPYLISGGCSTSLNSVYFISPNEGWAVGAWSGCDTCGTGSLFHYSNGSWENSDIGGPCCTLNGVYFTSPHEGWVVGGGPSSYLPQIMLQYWYGNWSLVTPLNATSLWELNSVHFTSSNEGWAVGVNNENKKGILLKFSAPFPDLTGQWSSLTQTCRNTLKGTKCSLKGKFTLQNIGDKDASSSIIKFYLSDNNIYNEGDTLLKQVSSATITAGGSMTGVIKFNLPTGQSAIGKYVIAFIDADNAVVESNESNNQVVYGPIP